MLRYADMGENGVPLITHRTPERRIFPGVSCGLETRIGGAKKAGYGISPHTMPGNFQDLTVLPVRVLTRVEAALSTPAASWWAMSMSLNLASSFWPSDVVCKICRPASMPVTSAAASFLFRPEAYMLKAVVSTAPIVPHQGKGSAPMMDAPVCTAGFGANVVLVIGAVTTSTIPVERDPSALVLTMAMPDPPSAQTPATTRQMLEWQRELQRWPARRTRSG